MSWLRRIWLLMLVLGTLMSPRLASAQAPLGLETRVGGLDLAAQVIVGVHGLASAGSYLGNPVGYDENASGCSLAARGALRFGAEDLVYGPSARGALRQLQESAGGRLLTDVGGPAARQSWTQFSIQTLQRQLTAGGRIRFDLTNMKDIPGALRGTGEFGNTVTAAELRFLPQNWSQFKGATTFYRNGAEVAAPW